MTKPSEPTQAQIPEDLIGLHKAASAYAIATRKVDVEDETISEETLNEIEFDFIKECAFFSKADHRNSDFRPFVVQELIERIAHLEAQLQEVTRELEGLRHRHNDGSDERYWAEWDKEPRYWAIVGFYIDDIIGVCTDQQDVLAEEPQATFIPISKEDFDSFDNWTPAKRSLVLASRRAPESIEGHNKLDGDPIA